MELLYRTGIFIYSLLIRLISSYNPKAEKWLQGRENWQEHMEKALENIPTPRIWMHCASLGEFEQGRTVLEALRQEYPSHKIILTFFSPSGYEVLKKSKLADAVFYLPLDTPNNSKQFVDLLDPSLVIFIKYEFWHFYSLELQKRKIPFYCISAIFRPSQIFFRFYGAFFRRMLKRYNHIFVQDQDSLSLLYKYRITNVTVAGDTRYDRVMQNKLREANYPILEAFCKSDRQILIAGSTWPKDELLLFETLMAIPDLKIVIAPHEINEEHLNEISHRFGSMSVFYSRADEQSAAAKRVLVIDSIGMLSLLYRFGNYTYVGGGFGAGIHNTLEAAVYGKPVFFGPRYDKFIEAKALVKRMLGYPVTQSSELITILRKMKSDESRLRQVSEAAAEFMEKRKGATIIFMHYLQMNYKHPN